MESVFKQLKSVPLSSKPNRLKIPVINLKYTEEDVNLFNKVYGEVLAHKDEYSQIISTESGGISYNHKAFKPPCYDIILQKASIQLTVCNHYGMFRLLVSDAIDKDDNEFSGKLCFEKLCNLLKKDGIDMWQYQIDNGKEVKQDIESYIVAYAAEDISDQVLDNCYHVDFHNSFASGLALTHPEFRPTIEKIHNKRAELKALKQQRPLTKDEEYTNSLYKAVLVRSIGYMQSLWHKAKWAHLAKDAIKNNNDRIIDLATEITQRGYKPLAFNTDGFWYQDVDNIGPYHDLNEGNDIGQWHTDHSCCRIRFKSPGSYEFIEDNKYTPVVRGKTLLDRIKARDNWEWGDIYKSEANVISYEFKEGVGICQSI